jgi:hypothetical protein
MPQHAKLTTNTVTLKPPHSIDQDIAFHLYLQTQNLRLSMFLCWYTCVVSHLPYPYFFDNYHSHIRHPPLYLPVPQTNLFLDNPSIILIYYLTPTATISFFYCWELLLRIWFEHKKKCNTTTINDITGWRLGTILPIIVDRWELSDDLHYQHCDFHPQQGTMWILSSSSMRQIYQPWSLYIPAHQRQTDHSSLLLPLLVDTLIQYLI